MALDRRIVSINFNQGLDQKTDPKLTTKLTTADNVVLRKNGTIEKRPGFVVNGNFSLSGNPVKIFPFNNGEFALTDNATDAFADSYTNSSGTYVTVALGNQQHSMARVGGTWMPQEPTYPCTVRASNLLSDSSTIGYSLGFVDVALCGVSATSSGFIVATDCANSILTTPLIYDIDSGGKSFAPINIPLVKSRVLSLSNTSLTAVAFGLMSTNVTTLAFCNVSSTSSASAVSATIPGVLAGGICWDAVALNNKIYFAAGQVVTENIIVGWYDPSNGSTSTTVVPSASLTSLSIVTVATPAQGTDRMRVFWKSNNVAVTVPCAMASYSFTLSQILAATSITVGITGFSAISATTTGQIRTFGAVENVGATSVFLAFSQVSLTYQVDYSAWNAEYSNTAVTVTGNLAPSLSSGLWSRMISKPFISHNRPSLILANSAATAQASTFIVTSFAGKMTPIARCLFGVSNPINGAGALPNVPSNGDIFYSTSMRVSNFRSINGTLLSNAASALLTINVSQTQAFPYVKRQDCTYLGGGTLAQYDGQGKTESGFYISPIILASSTSTNGGSLTAAVYSALVVKEFTDQAGYTHAGQPSQPIQFTTSTTTSKVALTISDGPNGMGVFNRIGQIKYAVFCTQGNGSIYYRANTSSLTYGNNLSYTPFTVTLIQSDATIGASDIVYTQGGALPHWMPDSCNMLFLHKNRLFCDDCSDETALRFSNELIPGSEPAFANVSVVSVPGAGRLTAGESLDSNAIIFRARSILVISGDGPDITGSNGSFSDAQLLYADVGAVNQRNICRFSAGIAFKSPDKGFYLLTRDFQLQYIGAEVEGYNSKTIVSSEVVALTEASGTVEECRFLCSDGTLLTYNYYNGQWTTATLSGCIDAVQTGGRYVVVNTSSTAANARVFQQSLSTYTDAFSNTSVTYQMTIETGWIKTADVQGFQRIWKAQLLGESQGPGAISVQVGYDYEAAYNETYTFNMSSMTTPNYTGGAQSIPQCDLVPVRQKCQAIRFLIKDYPTTGAVMKITNLSLECGVKSGVFKLPAAKGT